MPGLSGIVLSAKRREIIKRNMALPPSARMASVPAR